MTIVAPLSILAGCTFSGDSVQKDFSTGAISIADSTPSIAVDPFAQTTPLNQDPSTTDRLLDEDTIRLAVTAADLSKVTAQGLDWANQATGSSGVITNIQQRAEAGQTCRSFEATRNAYDGIVLYIGDICLDKGSGWWTRFMRPHSEDAA
ncbi:MAG: RT0821/Lpp0805 family surface protein [Pseudomonadota bacterium]